MTLNTAYGNGRICITMPGNYTFTWDKSTKKISIAYPTNVYYLRGGFNSWGWANPMTETSSGVYSATVNISSAEHLYSGDNGFKLLIGGQYYGKNSTTISATSNSATPCSTSGANIALATTVTGNYTFTYTVSTNTVAVTYPTITAMTGTVGLSVTGYESVASTDGSSSHPYYAFAGSSLTLDKTHTSGPSTDSHFKYTYYKGSAGGSTATTSIATKASTGTTSYSYNVGSTAGKYPMKVDAYWEYGPSGYKAKGAVQSSGIKYYQVLAIPSVALSTNKVSIKEGTDASFTLTATPSNITSGIAGVTYKFFRGNSTAEGDRISTVTKTAANSTQAATCDVTPTYGSTTDSWVYTVQMTYLTQVKTTTITIYRKWDIYVDDAALCNWGAMYIYMWDAGDNKPANFPGTAMSNVTGSSHWYTVELDSRYPNFLLDKGNNSGQSGNHTASIATYPAGTYYYLNSCTTLEELTITDPTVTLSASVANCKNITLNGNVSNFGGDGLAASRIKSVKFIVGGSDQAATTISTLNGNFSVTLNNATAGATNTLQAYAENIHGSATSSVLHYTNVTLDRQSGTTGTTAVTAVENMDMPAGATVPTRTGYTFGGYFAAANGSGTQYYNADMTSATNWDQTTNTKTLYAKWTANTYSVHFDGNGATSGEMADETGFTYDVSKALTANAFERTGYTFQGWATAPDGAKVYNDGQSVSNLSSTNGATVTLYAVWQAKT